MKVSSGTLKWILRFYPPFFFQRIWVKHISQDFQEIEIKINKSLLNINSNKSIFGGTIFAAADPVFPILFGSMLRKKGFPRVIAWLKSAQINYLLPARSSLELKVQISNDQIEHLLNTIKKEGKVIDTYKIQIYDKNKELCAEAICEFYIRDLNYQQIEL